MKNLYFPIKLLGQCQIARRAWFWHVASHNLLSTIHSMLCSCKISLIFLQETSIGNSVGANVPYTSKSGTEC